MTVSRYAACLIAIALSAGPGCGNPSGSEGDGGGSGPPCDTPMREGEATFYTFADGTGACGFAASTDFVAAMNMPDWSGSAVCGTCAAIDGPNGSVTVRIVDLCPECASGDLDLSPAAFDRIAERSAGRVSVTWREVPCEVSGPVIFHVDGGANGYYLAVNVRSHRHRVVRLERRTASGAWLDLTRQDYNVWVESPVDGAPVDAMHLRATDVNGAVIEADVPVTPGADVPASAQFPPC